MSQASDKDNISNEEEKVDLKKKTEDLQMIRTWKTRQWAHNIKSDRLRDLLLDKDKSKDVVIVDCRVKNKDFEGGNIKNAVHVDFNEFDVKVVDIIKAYHHKPFIVFHCMYSQVRGPLCCQKYSLLCRILCTHAQDKDKSKSITEKLKTSVNEVHTWKQNENNNKMIENFVKEMTPLITNETLINNLWEQNVYVLERGFQNWVTLHHAEENLVENFDHKYWDKVHDEALGPLFWHKDDWKKLCQWRILYFFIGNCNIHIQMSITKIVIKDQLISSYSIFKISLESNSLLHKCYCTKNINTFNVLYSFVCFFVEILIKKERKQKQEFCFVTPVLVLKLLEKNCHSNMWYLISFVLFHLFTIHEAAILADEVTTLPGWDGPLPSRQFSGLLNIPGSNPPRYITIGLCNTKIEIVQKTLENRKIIQPLILLSVNFFVCISVVCFTCKKNFEQGPFNVNDQSVLINTTEVPVLFYNNYTWCKVANVIFLESPAGVGFSYCNGQEGPIDSCPDWNDTNVAQDNHVVLQQFFKYYPEYTENDFYIAGESYAGIYVPTLVMQIEADSSGIPPLKGIAVGDGCMGIGGQGGCNLDDAANFWQFMWGHAQLSNDLYNSILSSCGSCLEWGNCSSLSTCINYQNQGYMALGGYNSAVKKKK
ncbi:hypothetical protein RFI_22883 [Reticulomyxa filosa]|uniref:Carboxypeptidase n=1 Tax=Reticulomyxa filosa TaxID=46433 RepID=X6MLH4_RETFI|nr:hypothetical protein RFI_22883 [Reticulomyxa filosa]|eukprot:ETO14486.1 hypothetical protein RFI_22883 [Reticulomyxa filosa]